MVNAEGGDSPGRDEVDIEISSAAKALHIGKSYPRTKVLNKSEVAVKSFSLLNLRQRFSILQEVANVTQRLSRSRVPANEVHETPSNRFLSQK